MSTALPNSIETYLGASNAHDTAAMLLYFAQDTVVHDEGQEYRGTAEVGGWIETTTEKYHTTIAVTDAKEEAGGSIITGRVSGDFEGSPVELRFHFALQNDKITALTIQ